MWLPKLLLIIIYFVFVHNYPVGVRNDTLDVYNDLVDDSANLTDLGLSFDNYPVGVRNDTVDDSANLTDLGLSFDNYPVGVRNDTVDIYDDLVDDPANFTDLGLIFDYGNITQEHEKVITNVRDSFRKLHDNRVVVHYSNEDNSLPMNEAATKGLEGVDLTSTIAHDTDSQISPLLLNKLWPTVQRLVVVVVCATCGTMMNGFYVAAFTVERNLKKVGNVFLAFLGISDMFITTGVMPAISVVILSGQWDNIELCHVLHFATLSSTYCYSIFFGFVAVETYFRLYRSTNAYEWFISMRVGVITVLIISVSVILSSLGVYLELDIDYCQRLHHGNFYFRAITGVLFHLIPGFVTVVAMIMGAHGIRGRARKQPQYKRSQMFERDKSILNLNILAFIMYVAGWLPYLVLTNFYPSSTNYVLYYSVWFGMLRSVFTPIFYCLGDSCFKRAFIHLFDYCCCKLTLSNSFTSRHRRAVDYRNTSGEVSVHIMQTTMNVNSPQRATSSSREMQEL